MQADVVFQLNFTSGIGDLYCCLVDILNTAKKCKALNLTCSLIYNFNKNFYFFDKKEITLFHFFKKEEFEQIFNDILKIDSQPNIEGFTHLFTIGLTPDRMCGGLHLWDLFLNNKKINFEKETRDTVACFSMYSSCNIDLIEEIPELSSNIKELAIKDNNLVSLYFRNNDCSEETSLINKNILKINDIINNNKTLISSNSSKIKNFFKENYKYNLVFSRNRHPEIGFQPYSYKYHCSDNEKLIENLEDTFAEMFNFSLCKEIFICTEWSRLSNFLFYSKLKQKDKQFTII